MGNKNELIIYWTSSIFLDDLKSVSLFYQTPQSLNSVVRKTLTNNDPGISACPAFKDVFHNVFVVKANCDDEHTLPVQDLITINNNPDSITYPLLISENERSTISMVRKSSYKNYSNLVYEMRWLFFSEESVNVKFTAPYFPATSPTPGAFLSPGRYDIGQWYRQFMLDYHIPLNDSTFKIKENDDLFYMHVETDKKVVFKKYALSLRLQALNIESSMASKRYGAFKSLNERYLMAKKTNYLESIRTEIKKNLLED